MADLFETVTATTNGETSRSITGAALVKVNAAALASEIMAKIPTADDEFVQQIKLSQTDVAAMDELVKTQCGDRLNIADVAALDEESVHKLLKSNQSNRSRRKSLPMTQTNYVELLTSAVAEWIIRVSCGIDKSSHGFGRTAVELNDETLAQLANDQDALGKAIRNIQSKKSTYKAKHADSDYENDAEWLDLLEKEAALKALRTTQPAGRKGLSLKKALQFIFDGVVESDKLTQEEAIAVIDACRALSKGVYPEEFVAAVAEAEAAKAEAIANADEEADI
jgi:hypothetical protein